MKERPEEFQEKIGNFQGLQPSRRGVWETIPARSFKPVQEGGLEGSKIQERERSHWREGDREEVFPQSPPFSAGE